MDAPLKGMEAQHQRTVMTPSTQALAILFLMLFSLQCFLFLEMARVCFFVFIGVTLLTTLCQFQWPFGGCPLAWQLAASLGTATECLNKGQV